MTGPGVVTDRVVDHHVHLQLIDVSVLVGGGLAGIVDLGANPAEVARLARICRDRGLTAAYAGAFLAAPGGYPGDRAWCPPGAVREVRSPADAADATAEQAAHGASLIKVTLNADGPVLDPEVLGAVVAAAHARLLPVVAHVEGPGTAQNAIRAGVDALTHTPWTERLADASIAEAVAARQRWISTLAIHARDPQAQATALDNLARFHAAGGRVLYGTDLGNGGLPLGVNADEVAALHRAGLDDAAVAVAMADPWPTGTPRAP